MSEDVELFDNLEPACPCRLPPALHVCQACNAERDHVDLVRTGAGFRCRVPCRPPAVQRAPARQVHRDVHHDDVVVPRRRPCLLCRQLYLDLPLGLCPSCTSALYE
jgi:hypothetical protein